MIFGWTPNHQLNENTKWLRLNCVHWAKINCTSRIIIDNKKLRGSNLFGQMIALKEKSRIFENCVQCTGNLCILNINAWQRCWTTTSKKKKTTTTKKWTLHFDASQPKNSKPSTCLCKSYRQHFLYIQAKPNLWPLNSILWWRSYVNNAIEMYTIIGWHTQARIRHRFYVVHFHALTHILCQTATQTKWEITKKRNVEHTHKI